MSNEPLDELIRRLNVYMGFDVVEDWKHPSGWYEEQAGVYVILEIIEQMRKDTDEQKERAAEAAPEGA